MLGSMAKAETEPSSISLTQNSQRPRESLQTRLGLGMAASAEGTEVGGDRDVGDGDDDERAGGDGRARRGAKSMMWGRLAIRFDGEGNFSAVRLRASFENHRLPLRSQLLYVTCEPSFSLEDLREVVRALQPVLDFVLVE